MVPKAYQFRATKLLDVLSLLGLTRRINITNFIACAHDRRAIKILHRVYKLRNKLDIRMYGYVKE